MSLRCGDVGQLVKQLPGQSWQNRLRLHAGHRTLVEIGNGSVRVCRVERRLCSGCLIRFGRQIQLAVKIKVSQTWKSGSDT
jgi:hypothetical protein